MSYVDAFHHKDKDIVYVVERVNGQRVQVEHRPEYNFYVADPRGSHRSIYGDPVAEIRCRGVKDFRKNVAINRSNKTYESDIKPINKTIAKHYNGAETPKLQTAFFDIEVDFDPQRGYASPEEAFMPITAIGVYLDWMDTMVCLAVPPRTLSWEQAQSIASGMPEVLLFKTEKEMLEVFLTLIDDADIVSGWNSEGYDIPYTVHRIIKVLGKSETRRLCLWDQFPKERTYEAFGSERVTYDLIGRVHLDYMQLYRKYNYEERHSYRLDYIAEMELGERKVPYEGSLDRLYNHDFEKFLEYNIQDTILLGKMDKKLQFIDLANTIAHDNTVLLPTTMGAVATTEQAIINEAHRRGFVVPDRKREENSDTQAAGAYVAFPKKGFHEWVGSMDINSLYPSVFRALNMAAETIVGQVRLEYTEKEINDKTSGRWRDEDGSPVKVMSFADAWMGKFACTEYDLIMNKDTNILLHLDMEDGNAVECTGADIYNLIFHSGQPWNISANGTIFKTDFQGIVPGLLERWYSERKELQAKKKDATTSEEKAFWDKRQLVKKINLNSLYGAILNPGCRFFDKRIGQSTTLTGRSITKFMASKTNELLTGKFDHVGDCIIYGDTDSVYFTAVPALPKESELDLEGAVKLYDHISDTVSDAFPQFLKEAFNVPLHNGKVLKAGREVVGRAGLFITKKRYAINCWDIEGYQPEGGKLKIMGMEIKRSDTPEFVQDFLEEVLNDALSGKTESEVIEKIRAFKKEFQSIDPWKKGMPKRVNNLTTYTKKIEKSKHLDNNLKLKKLNNIKDESTNNTVPGHVRASINWNELKQANGDQYSMSITDGAKVIVCRLKNNPMGYSSIAYPTDELKLPQWFKDLPFDESDMETAVLDKKVQNVLGQMGWEIERANDSEALQEFFEF
jgi:DNA polymerase elongation subunit (family B)